MRKLFKNYIICYYIILLSFSQKNIALKKIFKLTSVTHKIIFLNNTRNPNDNNDIIMYYYISSDSINYTEF